MKNSKILITGGSGFIGTNLIEHFLKNNNDVLSIDIKAPKILEHHSVYKKIDIVDLESFKSAVLAFNPDYIIHLAARTDLDGKTLEDYAANTTGVQNLMTIVSELPTLKKLMVASSKFVTENNYQIKDQFDYCPHTVYGESKVETERMVWKNAPSCDWCIIRPTSIWGPWFGVPYRNFFDVIKKRMYFHIGNIKCYKTYGFIGNSIYQIETLLSTETTSSDDKVFYIGDEPAYEINEWADEIAKELGFNMPTMPVWFVKLLAKFGDFVGVFGFHFPMQSFRYNNMTKDGKNDLKKTLKIAPNMPFTRIEGVKETLKWMQNN
ncbi:NAD-dependent epimerase/dehydratase family protein [Wenyingzhuangia marina]|uniref:Nucleoside-diphosphate-sugar epimerase n=1 Tax=Wenyingzhuangia marina TaxID=1195760 RepID=A0A1M5WCZ7_9FLAO|nr:NAD(P)-dependent oxidoreductase [Wenyingzhuangia marina]GGF81840.1 NDP-sugar dehydratase or epimerase [Wenyingzhuangia marina]SHH85298.1 Nucleoside-diphosphate-sugar epimerase [Wenyingzhuangia marina]